MKASLKNYRQAPRKMRLVANSLKGKRVGDAITELTFMPKKAAEPLKKLIESAVANAKQADTSVDADALIIRSMTVDKGMTMTRFMPRAFGRASPIRRISSHVKLTLGPAYPKKGAKEAVSEAPKTEKKAVATKPAAKKRVSKKAA